MYAKTSRSHYECTPEERTEAVELVWKILEKHSSARKAGDACGIKGSELLAISRREVHCGKLRLVKLRQHWQKVGGAACSVS